MGQCKEFCGLSPREHAPARLRARRQQEFEAWVAEQQAPAERRRHRTSRPGREAVPRRRRASTVTRSRAPRQQRRRGPDLTHFASRETFAGAIFETNEENLADVAARSARDETGLADAGLRAFASKRSTQLVAYLMSLD